MPTVKQAYNGDLEVVIDYKSLQYYVLFYITEWIFHQLSFFTGINL